MAAACGCYGCSRRGHSTPESVDVRSGRHKQTRWNRSVQLSVWQRRTDRMVPTTVANHPQPQVSTGCAFLKVWPGLGRSGLFQVVFIVSGTKVSHFLFVPEKPVWIQKLFGSKVRKASAAREGDWRHTVSANQTHCLHVCFAPDYGIYV